MYARQGSAEVNLAGSVWFVLMHTNFWSMLYSKNHICIEMDCIAKEGEQSKGFRGILRILVLAADIRTDECSFDLFD